MAKFGIILVIHSIHVNRAFLLQAELKPYEFIVSERACVIFSETEIIPYRKNLNNVKRTKD